MNILLVKPPFARLIGADAYLTYPIGLMYVAGMLRGRGHEVAIYHDDVSNPNPINEILHHRPGSGGVALRPYAVGGMVDEFLAPLDAVLHERKPDVVGVSYCTADRAAAVAVARMAKGHGIRVVAGGIHPSLLPDDELEWFDAVVVGEGDSPLAAWAFEDNETAMTYTILPLDCLDDVLPARDVVIGGEKYPPFLWGHVQTQRGCPYRCGFCSAPTVFGSKVRRRDPVRVREEVEQLPTDTGRIVDDSFGVVRQHASAVCKELAKVRFRWWCDIALQEVDEYLLDDLAGGGCGQVNMGVESAVPRWQAIAGKKVEPLAPERVCGDVLARGMQPVYYFMIGFPGETLEELEATLEYAERLKGMGARICISVLNAYPKTKIWDMLPEEKRVLTSYIHQSEEAGYADCSREDWHRVVEEANRLNG